MSKCLEAKGAGIPDTEGAAPAEKAEVALVGQDTQDKERRKCLAESEKGMEIIRRAAEDFKGFSLRCDKVIAGAFGERDVRPGGRGGIRPVRLPSARQGRDARR